MLRETASNLPLARLPECEQVLGTVAAQRALDFAVGLPLGDGLALLVLALAAPDADLQLRHA